jgi:hypothetical protein
MPTLSELFNLDPKVERLALMPRMRGSLGSDYGVSPEMQNSVMFEGKKGFMPDVIAPKVLYDFIRAIKAPGRAARGEVLDEEEALNTALNMFGGGLATSGSVPIGALGMSARTAPAGTVPLREIPRSPLGFYSKVEEATLPLQNKGSGGQFLAQIQKTPGVKPEEIEVLGLDKFLQSKPTVTKQEVQDYITANKPDVQEVRLDEPQFTTENRLELESLFNIPRRERTSEQSSRVDELLAISDSEINQPTTKFSKYTIPGGENYREILLTLPQKVEKGFMTPNGAFFSEADLADPIVRSTAEKIGLSPAFRNVGDAYRSSHYEQPNILTHLRANDRVIDGKKALFIEEIQSDWHQAGRKKGYGPQTETEAYYITPDGSRVSLGFGKTQEEAAAAVDPGWKNLVDIKFDTQTKKFGEGVPDAPFKKSWHELALKRAIQEAVDKGYDKLAFTTGKTQAERYDLSKQVSTLRAPYDNGEYVVSYIPKGANDYEYMGRFLEKDLPDAVGKELAEKIVANKDIQTMTYKGDDLRVGGEGMKGFYDEILPKALQNLTKKYGTKVTKTTMKAGQDVTEPGIVAPGVGMEFAGKTTKAPEVEVWSIDITPQMREQIASKGQPLFATAPPLGLAAQDPLEQFLGYQEAENDPLMQFLGQK